MNSDRLKEHSMQLKKYAKSSMEYAAAHPEDGLASLVARNQEGAAIAAEQDYLKNEQIESGLLMDLRFKGIRADGSMPLESFLKIFDPLMKAIKSAAFNVLTGKSESRIPDDLKEMLNLKLAGITYGSTRVWLSGSTAVDLTDESVLATTFNRTFDLLNSDNDHFYDSLNSIGGVAALQLGEALDEIQKAGFAVDLSWNSDSQQKFWNGSTDNIARVSYLLSNVKVDAEYDEAIAGEVQSISTTGIKLRTDEGLVTIKYPLRLLPIAQSLKVSTHTELNVHTVRYFSQAKRGYEYSHILTAPDLIN